MTAPVQDTLDTRLDAVVRDWRPSRVEAREAIRRAVMRAASEHHGLVHVADFRPYLPPWISQPQVGSYIAALVRAGFLKPTNRYRPNGGIDAGNGSKPAQVRRLVRAIPPGELDTRKRT